MLAPIRLTSSNSRALGSWAGVEEGEGNVQQAAGSSFSSNGLRGCTGGEGGGSSALQGAGSGTNLSSAGSGGSPARRRVQGPVRVRASLGVISLPLSQCRLLVFGYPCGLG